MASEVEETLIEAGLLISKPENWAKGALARRASGAPLTNPASAYATSWDAIGAIYCVLRIKPTDFKVSREDFSLLSQCLAALSLTASREYKRTVEGINDDKTHGDVLALYRATIRHWRAQNPDARGQRVHR